MVWNPLVPTARAGRSQARNRRMVNWATTQQGPAGISMTIDFIDTGFGPSAGTLDDPSVLGEMWLGGIDNNGGGGLVITVGTEVQFGAGWQADLTFGGAGSYAFMIAITKSNALRWAVVRSYGVT